MAANGYEDYYENWHIIPPDYINLDDDCKFQWVDLSSLISSEEGLFWLEEKREVVVILWGSGGTCCFKPIKLEFDACQTIIFHANMSKDQ